MANTLYDYYTGQGKSLPSVGERAKLFESYGLGSASSYTGSSSQNTALLGKLSTGGSTNNTSSINASEIQAPVNVPYSSGSQENYITGISAELATTRKALDDMLATQKATTDAKLAEAKVKEQDVLSKVEPLTTPFRSDLETTQRESLFVNKNFEENQKLIDELDSLLTEGNTLIKQQQEVTGLAAVRNPRIQKTMDDITARAGVIQAVINARNGQISVAENLIDRSVNAIAADRKDQIDYYNTILELNNRDIVSLDAESKKIAEEQLNLKKFDLDNVQKSADKIKDLMIDPATAGLVAEAGIKLTDSIETINSKLAKATYAKEVRDESNKIMAEGGVAVASPAGIPANQLKSFKDSKGVMHYYKVPVSSNATGTATERSVSAVATTISNSKMNFPNVVYKFANQMSLSEIYSAYAQSTMGQQYGLPNENPSEIADLYKVAKGEMTEDEYKEKWNK